MSEARLVAAHVGWVQSKILVPPLADTSVSFTQLLEAEQTSQSVQESIQRKKDAIRTLKQQALDKDILYNAICEHLKLLEEDICGLKRLLQYNEASRRHWRRLHLEAWRATVRPLKAVDLPIAILTMVFANFQDVPTAQIQVKHSFQGLFLGHDELPSTGVATIKNIRLTCHAFCDAASRFLLQLVDVFFTRSSLRLLEDISNHPTISKGVRIIQIHTNEYDALLANDREHFCNKITRELQHLQISSSIENSQARRDIVEDCHLAGLIPKPKYLKIRGLDMVWKDVQDLLVIVNKYKLQGPEATVPLDRFEAKVIKAIVQTHEEYQRRYQEQKSLAQQFLMCGYISTALCNMPSVERLCITRRWRGRGSKFWSSGWENKLDAQKCKSILRGPNPFKEIMLPAINGSKSFLDWTGDPPMSLVLELPSVLQAGCANLTHLDIDFPTVENCRMGVEAEYLQQIRHACQHLRVVQVAIYSGNGGWSSPASLANTYTVLEAMLISPRLEGVKLAFTTFNPSSSDSVGPLLINLSCNKLRDVCLRSFPVKVAELRQFLDKVPGHLHLEFTRIYLMEGTWAEALEILRGRADPSSRVCEPRGVEDDTLSEREALYLRHEFDSEHRDGWYSSQRCPGPASFYIRGENIPNPLIWDND